jgi:hypothetical protein
MHPKRSAAKTNRDRKNQLISVIKAWNAYISDREITRIIVRDTEEIPKFVTINSAPQK